jgi:lactoylglutathione lyase
MGERRIAGLGLHVGDLARSVDFYTAALGMRVMARYEFDSLTEVLVGFGETGDAPSIVLVDRAGHTGPVGPGSGFDRVLVMIDDVAAVCARVHEHGGAVTREPDAPAGLGVPVTIAMVTDPDGYGLELIEQVDT